MKFSVKFFLILLNYNTIILVFLKTYSWMLILASEDTFDVKYVSKAYGCYN